MSQTNAGLNLPIIIADVNDLLCRHHQRVTETAGAVLFAANEDADSKPAVTLTLSSGVLPCSSERLDTNARTGIPCFRPYGAQEVINFGSPRRIPVRCAERPMHTQSPQVTLVSTTLQENAPMKHCRGEKMNTCKAEVRVRIVAGGVSALDAPDQPIWDPEALAAFLLALYIHLQPTGNRPLLKTPYAISDPHFSQVMVKKFEHITHSLWSGCYLKRAGIKDK